MTNKKIKKGKKKKINFRIIKQKSFYFLFNI